MSDQDTILNSNNSLVDPPTRQEVKLYAFPASYGQKQLWFLNQIDQQSAVYNIPFAFRLKGKLKIAPLEKSLNQIISRHETFRTTFAFRDDKLTQFIISQLKINIEIFDFSQETERERLVNGKVEEFTLKPFNLEKGPLIRSGIIKLNDIDHVLMFSFHHTILDHTAVLLFFNELSSLYNSYVQNENPDLQVPSIQYADMVVWQMDEKRARLFKNKLDYWCEQLKNQEGVLELPIDKPRPERQSFNGAEKKINFSKELSKKIHKLSRKEKKSVFTVLLSAYKVLLFRYTNTTDITVGAPFANRTQPDMEDVMGCCMNTLPLRTKFLPEDSFLTVLDKVREVVLGAQENQEISFEQIVEEIKPERHAALNPLFQVSFMFQEPLTTIPLIGIDCRSVDIKNDTSRFDFTLWMWDGTEGFEGLIQYNTDLFEEETIDRIYYNFLILLEEIVAFPEKKVSELEILSNNEKSTLITDWNKTESNYPKESCVHQLFESATDQFPENIAVEFNNQEITYKELNNKANCLANYLKSIGIGRGSLVGICLDRSIEMMIGLLGVIKSGGAYVPLDPSFPLDRLSFMTQDSNISTLLTQSKYSGLIKGFSGYEVCLDRDSSKIDNYEISNTNVYVTSEDPVYVLYTSGSTGQPKGVEIKHRSLVNFLFSMKEKPGLNQNDVLLSLTTLSFDIAGLELFLPLITGAKVILVSKEISINGRELLNIIESKKVTIMQATPATFRLMILSGWKKKISVKLLCGGEQLPVDLAEKLIRYSKELWNMYGPTETTIWSTTKKITDIYSINIGKPIANTTTYILNDNLKPIPIGAIGELFIGGDGLAKGYLNRPDLTEKSFVNNPFLTNSRSKIYKTGDLARYKSNGEIEYIGRVDNQLKVRGFRVEPGEIESILSKHEIVRQSLITVQDDLEGNSRLVAYLTINEDKLKNIDNLINEHVSEWQVIWNNTYQNGDIEENPEFNLSGWKSSYSDRPIPDEEMHEWVDNTVENILEYNPKKILEIGCGTGLLLFRLAPYCDQYTGIDFSKTILDTTQKVVQSKNLSNVKLFNQAADDLNNIETDFYDMIILNSVIQYFPGIDYLINVIKKSLSVLKPGGQIFIGDVRNIQLLKIFAMSVELEKAENKTTSSDLLELVNKRISEEEELVIDPQFFFGLQKYLPGISNVKVTLKRGENLNELTKYRYDVILLKEDKSNQHTVSEWINFDEKKLDLKGIATLLNNGLNDLVAIKNIPNSRVLFEVRLFDYLSNSHNNDNVSLQSIKAEFQEKYNNGINPADVAGIGAKFNYKTHLIYSSEGIKEYFDVVFQRIGDERIYILESAKGNDSDLHSYANNPLFPKFKRTLLPKLKENLQSKLPDYMIPSVFVLINEMPLTPNKKIDRKRLPLPEITTVSNEGYLPPRDDIEIKLTSVWEKTLGIKPIGIKENFFELGGHSLLAAQLFARIEQIFGASIPLAILFQAQTIESLAKIIRKKDWNSEWTSLVPIKPSGSKPPLFLVHGAEGNILLYRELANLLGDDQPVYGLQSKGIDGKEEFNTTFEEMAEHYIREICELQPKGPYYLGGYCLGGAIAYEMANQLTARGEEVPLLALLETYNIKSNCSLLPAHYKFFHKFQNLYYHLKNVMEAKSLGKKNFIREKINIELSRFKVKWHIVFSKITGYLNKNNNLKFHHLLIDKMNDKAQEKYQPTQYEGKVILYKPKGRFKGYSDPNFGWDHLVKGEFKVVNLPFYLRGMLVDPYVKILANELKMDIERATKDSN